MENDGRDAGDDRNADEGIARSRCREPGRP
jgi:hypothetical protein